MRLPAIETVEMPLLIAAFLLGFIAGLRTFTAPAVLWLMRHGSPLAYLLGALALAEYIGDLHPKAPPRTRAVGLAARAISGAFCGWAITSSSGAWAIAGGIIGAVAAVIGAYVGLALPPESSDRNRSHLRRGDRGFCR